MDIAPVIEAATEEFKQKLSQQCQDLNLARLTPALAEQISRSLQQALSAAGVAGFRTFLHGYEEEAPTVEIDGGLYRWKKASAKRFLTPFGEMVLERNLYQRDYGGPTYIPLDRQWGMEGEFATVEIRESVLFAGALVTPNETVQLLQKSALFHPSATAIQHILEETGVWLEYEGEDLPEAIRPDDSIPDETQTVVASLDGVQVRLDEEGVKQGPPFDRPGQPSETTTPTCFKRAMVGSLSLYGAPLELDEEEMPPERLVTRYVAEMPEEKAVTLKARFEAEIRHLEASLSPSVKKVLLCDGERSLWKYAESNPLFADYQMLVDFYHSCEHLADAAEALWGAGSPKAHQWYEEYRHKLLHEDKGARSVLRSIDYYGRTRRFSSTRRQAIDTQRTFFQRNQKRMTYAAFRQQGLPIGSGPVEAACKTLVKTRLCRSGMRWSWPGGQRILQLRTYVKSERWDAFWKQYKQRWPAHYDRAA
jgi:hypothetical protein